MQNEQESRVERQREQHECKLRDLEVREDGGERAGGESWRTCYWCMLRYCLTCDLRLRALQLASPAGGYVFWLAEE